MSESRIVMRTSAQLGGAPALARWHATVARCDLEAGPFDVRLVSAWRDEIEAVRARVGELEATAGGCGEPAGGEWVIGRHALVALAAARSGALWLPEQLVAVAAAVELAYRATRHHDEVRDRCAGPPAAHGQVERDETLARDDRLARDDNRRHVLDGDWSITQAAVLVADVGPDAYRLLVRGYGAAQVSRFAGRDSTALLASALSLGQLVAGVPQCTSVVAGSVGERVYRWAASADGGR